MKTIIFDVDGVLADFVWGFSSLAGCKPPWTVQQHKASWDFNEVMDRVTWKETWAKVMNDPLFWYNLPALISEDVWKQIEELHSDNQVLFVTNRMSSHNAQDQTRAWLEKHGIHYPNVVLSAKKGEIAAAVAADYHLDDKPQNAAAVHWMADRRPCISYFLRRTHTESATDWLPKNIRVVTSVSEYLRDIEEGV